MPQLRKIAIIGAGRLPAILGTLAEYGPLLPLAEIALYDEDIERARGMAARAQRLIVRAGSEVRVSSHDDLGTATAGTDVVVNCLRPGGARCRRIDRELPLEFGMPAHDNIGVGAFCFGLRAIPAALRIAEIMKHTAPGSALINYTPAAHLLTQAVSDADGPPVFGLSREADSDLERLAEAARIDPDPCRAETIGCGGAWWYTDVTFGREPLDRVRARVEPQPGWCVRDRLELAAARELADRTPGYWPGSQLAYYTHPELFVAHQRASDWQNTDDDALDIESLRLELDSVGGQLARARLERRPSPQHNDRLAGVLFALCSASGAFLAHIANGPTVSKLASSSVVHAKLVPEDHAVSRSAPALPSGWEKFVFALEAHQRATSAAASHSDGDEAITALALDPTVRTEDNARRILDRASEEYGNYLPIN